MLMTIKQISETIKEYIGSKEYDKLNQLQDLYDADNPEIIARGAEKQARGKTPNNVIPTGYYSTVTNTMGGYMFLDVQYICDDLNLQANMDAINEANNVPAEDMKIGLSALAYNKGIEYIYTDESSEIKIRKLSQINTIIIRSDDIDETPTAAINFRRVNKEENIYTVLYIEPTLEIKFTLKDDAAADIEERTLLFDDLPVIEYKAQILGKKAPFEVVIPYIRGLDALISGNANEIDRLVEALLVLGKDMSEEELAHSEEWKALLNFSKEDRAEYLVKEMSPEFRKYVSELLIMEIYKHAHVVDWNSESGQASDASGAAWDRRIQDMKMFSKTIEMAYREGAHLRLKAIDKIAAPLKMPIGKVKIIYNRTNVDDKVDKAVKLSTVTFMSDITKREMIGIDEEKEQERLAIERPAGIVIEDAL